MDNEEIYYQKIKEISKIKNYNKQRKEMQEAAELFKVKFKQVFKDVREQIHKGRGF